MKKYKGKNTLNNYNDAAYDPTVKNKTGGGNFSSQKR